MANFVVYTSLDKCRRCYHCVRECPVKAIRVEDGQAMVVDELCISCGMCVKVCHQNAKRFVDEVDEVRCLLQDERTVVAIVAPSFVAAYPDTQPGKIVAALRELGFDSVNEVAFGAELVSDAYRQLIDNIAAEEPESPWEEVLQHIKPPYISTPCPAVVRLVELHHPEIIDHLIPIVSPMIAMGRYLKTAADDDLSVVFMGPCVAKKMETDDVGDAIDVSLTFREMDELFNRDDVEVEELEPVDFDPPHPQLASVFPVPGGLLRSAEVSVDILDERLLVAEGPDDVEQVLESIHGSSASTDFVDLLFCEGCIDGPVLDSDLNLLQRRELIVDYTVNRPQAGDDSEIPEFLNQVDIPVDALFRDFSSCSQHLSQPTEEELKMILHRVGKYEPEDELNCGACGYPTCRDKAIAVYRDFAEAEMCLPHMIEQLEETLEELEQSYRELHDTYAKLQETQDELVQAEKMSSLGQLSAGIAHELNNPLGGILLHAGLIHEDEVPDEVGDYVCVIKREAARCREIVKGLLNFARQSRLQKKTVVFDDFISGVVNEFFEQTVAQELSVSVETDFNADHEVDIDPSQMHRVIVNLLDNAVDAVEGSGEITVRTFYDQDSEEVQVVIADDGIGIPDELESKLFTPFFTTKEPGKGTGLGLPIAYGIVKMHRGQIEVESEAGEGTEVKITLPCQSGPPVGRMILQDGDNQAPFE